MPVRISERTMKRMTAQAIHPEEEKLVSISAASPFTGWLTGSVVADHYGATTLICCKKVPAEWQSTNCHSQTDGLC